MRPVVRAKLPSNSLLNSSQYHYSDSYLTTLKDIYTGITPTQMGKAFFRSAPQWTESLFMLRNRMVSFMGLKASTKPQNHLELLAKFKCEPGEVLGLFKVFSKTDREVILGEDDKHLNFRVSLFCEPNPEGAGEKRLIISTTVKFNNWFGRLYFLPVRPIHRLIVPAMLKGMVKQLENIHKEQL
ncbi:DUF2867 domain-containing protein [Paradesertivirga mongoliensis]|uniref:DUF2867 domain-containing protein n=1 Tax=Paradesertivirga mongoliensis TaxID=2100740 RepID=A0ABW4ZQU3_9SPHI|nr:DUF2867 domain-containing protein [Pedobacter mongoliensis]